MIPHKYVEDNGKIYRFRKKHNDYILCTPWKNGEDRRYKWENFVSPEIIGCQNALAKISKVWREDVTSWTHNGKKYETRGQVYDEKVVTPKRVKYNWCNRYFEYNHIEYTKLFELCPVHTWHKVSDYVDKKGIHHHHEYDNNYYLCMYNGKLVWVVRSQYIPNVYYYKFESIDKEPKKWGGWSNINCIKPVYCITDKKFI